MFQKGRAKLMSMGGFVGAISLTLTAISPRIYFCDKEQPYLDPDAWERAAKALRDINSQANAKLVFNNNKSLFIYYLYINIYNDFILQNIFIVL